ncbi:MAG: hypothetical protein PF590_07565 [Candidatus Delongbacteria bacterium]|jgi:hypothetical protein|nr:hypothetical protein [Candidatus Delongbacteria bacterium]
MATYTVHINERTKAGKNLVNLLKSLNNVVQIHKTPNGETTKAMQDVKDGNVVQTKGKKDFFNKLNA